MYLRVILACVIASGLSSQSFAQAQPAPTQPSATTPAGPGEQMLSNAELDALVAPIALYPDTLLAQVLMASTYPLEVVQADRWVSANKKLKGDQLKSAAEQQAWDASVKSLVATPSVLEMMSKNLDWTQKLGDAVLAQQPDVMDGIQRMRTRAYDNKKLTSGSQHKVSVKQESGRQTIAIEAATAETVYVPYYDPAVVYGTWPYAETQPYYFTPPGYIATGVIATGIAFGAGYALGRWAWSGNYWGGNINWNNNNINIDRDRVTHWQHNSQHRHGVQYRNAAVQQRFGNNSVRAGGEGRMDFRGRSGEQVIQPRGDRPERGDARSAARPDQRPGDRAGAGAGQERRTGDRAGDGSRPDRGAGQRASAGDRGRGRDAGSPRAAQQNRPRPSASRAGPARDSAFGNMQPGRAASLQSQRGQASFAHSRPGGAARAMPAGGPRMGSGGFSGGARMGGGGFGGGRGGGGRGGGGRRSDALLKDHVVLLGRLASGVGFYRFEYKGSDTTYVGVIAQEVQGVAPKAVSRGADGYLRVDYELLGLRFQTFGQWKASGARIPSGDIRH